VTLLIDTAAVPARERVDFWSESSYGPYHPLQIRSAAKGKFWARMWRYELGPLGVFRIVAAGNTMIRTSRAIAAGDPECVHVSVILAGQLNAAQSGRHCVARAGDMMSYETSHPVILQADHPFETLVVQIPRRLLGRHAEKIGNLTAVKRSGSERLPRATAAYLSRVAHRLEQGSLALTDAPRTAERVLDLTRSLYADGAGGEPPSRSRAEILLNVESFIEANIGDPLLDPEHIARATFISTRYLHKLFAAEGTSVCRWIRASRLEGCRHDLLDPALHDDTILTIASRWGLTSPQHFCRLFHSTYGCSPREFRRGAWLEAAIRDTGSSAPAC
jgi:AraC-like DNA-binding protein